jgi:hypothetical protein
MAELEQKSNGSAWCAAAVLRLPSKVGMASSGTTRPQETTWIDQQAVGSLSWQN